MSQHGKFIKTEVAVATEEDSLKKELEEQKAKSDSVPKKNLKELINGSKDDRNDT